MYGLKSFDSVVAFVNGYDCASNGTFLLGFREWLIVRLSAGNNLSWIALVRRLTDRPRESANEVDEGTRALFCFFDALELFFRERDSPNGYRKIFASYESWLKNQSWYDSSSPIWIQID
jgi:hypothetical protein